MGQLKIRFSEQIDTPGSDIAESSVEAKLRQAGEALFVARGANQ